MSPPGRSRGSCPVVTGFEQQQVPQAVRGETTPALSEVRTGHQSSNQVWAATSGWDRTHSNSAAALGRLHRFQALTTGAFGAAERQWLKACLGLFLPSNPRGVGGRAPLRTKGLRGCGQGGRLGVHQRSHTGTP